MSELPALHAAPHDVLRPAHGDAPRVSAVVPAYNVRGWLRAAVESLLAQTCADHEVIVVDDASTDRSSDVLADLADPRLRIVRHHANHGLPGARNTGLALARGAYLALLDADDLARPRRFERQVALLEARPAVGLVGTWWNRFDAERRLVIEVDRWRLPDAALAPYLLFNNAFCASSLMIRRRSLPPHGFRPVYAEDYALSADISRVAELAMVRETLVDYRLAPGSIMRSRLDRVAADALATQRALLAEVGVEDADFDDAAMKVLMHYGGQQAGAMGLDWLERTRRWMLRVGAANARSRRYREDALRQASARMWDLLLLHATKLERLPPGWRYATRLVPFLWRGADLSLRGRALAHAALNALPFELRRDDAKLTR